MSDNTGNTGLLKIMPREVKEILCQGGLKSEADRLDELMKEPNKNRAEIEDIFTRVIKSKEMTAYINKKIEAGEAIRVEGDLKECLEKENLHRIDNVDNTTEQWKHAANIANGFFHQYRDRCNDLDIQTHIQIGTLMELIFEVFYQIYRESHDCTAEDAREGVTKVVARLIANAEKNFSEDSVEG